jgi:coiled-coil domain-containing protein 12
MYRVYILNGHHPLFNIPLILRNRELLQLQSEEVNIVPKHPNWDLKQGIQTKVDKLKRKTQKAIVEILREKLASAQGEAE